jgi:filamentous hemagglutinin
MEIQSNTIINFYGPIYRAEAAARLLNELSGGEQNSVGLQNHVADPVRRLLDGNPPTGGTILEGSSSLKEMWRAGTGQQNTTHNCYGSNSPRECQPFWMDTHQFTPRIISIETTPSSK